MKLEVKPVKKIEDGKHSGVITGVSYRTEPYQYTDIHIEFDENKITYGVPTTLTKESKLGKLLEKFGTKLETGLILDPEVLLKGKKCQFMTLNKETKNGTFATVVEGSLVPK